MNRSSPSANWLAPVCRADLVGHTERGEAQLTTGASETARRGSQGGLPQYHSNAL